MCGVITIVGAPLVGALNNDNGVDVSNDDMTKINSSPREGRAQGPPLLIDAGKDTYEPDFRVFGL